MKYLFTAVLLSAAIVCNGQKYVLLDEAITEPAVYTDHLSDLDRFKNFFPVEVKDLPQFVNVLEQIIQRLNKKKFSGGVKNYTVGCTQFTGKAFPLASGERIDYVITSVCEQRKVTMHLCDARLSNSNNAYFVQTWIKYIRNNLKPSAGNR